MTEITVTELAALTDPVVVDVREQDEYDAGHLPGVVHIPMTEFVARLNEVPEGAPVFVVCAVGGRSQQVVSYLEGRGVEAVNVAGGTVAWQQAGLPLVQGA